MLGHKCMKTSFLYLLIIISLLSCLTTGDKDIADIAKITELQTGVELSKLPIEIVMPRSTIESIFESFIDIMSELDVETIPEPAVEMVYFEERLLNIFFHPVIARPEIAFNSRMKAYFLNWFVTADEYKKILYELYLQDYVLVNIDETYEVVYEDGSKIIIEKKVLVPAGKKPVILSVDDLSYYQYMKAYGVVHKLVIDENNEIAAWTNNENGGELSYNNDVITILEDFIKQHPDFSLRGARGIIALTGFEGVLGYATQGENPEYQEEAEKAVVVVNKLKELGWRFASHSFTHEMLPRITYEMLEYDIDRWDIEVRPITGYTDLYVYPYGAGLEVSHDRHQLLRDWGFNLFFGVGNGYRYITTPEYIFYDRLNIDGTYFRDFRNRRDRIFDINKVMDSRWRNR